MAGECGVILKVVEPIRSFMFDAVGKYIGYIGSCEDNLVALRKSLSDVCNKKDDINKKVKEGIDKQEEITREAASWLKDVRLLAEDEELKALMYKDMETAKFVVKMMGKKDLKRRISEEKEMQVLVVKVMKKLEEEMNKSEEEMRKIAEVDYKQVAEVVVEVMKDTMDEFKALMKEDKKMAVIATRTLKDRDLDKLMKGDKEMEEIVREAENVSDEELWQNNEHEESNALLAKTPEVDASNNTVKDAAKKLFTPLTYLLTPLRNLMNDANFKKAVPEADAVKLGLEVIDGLMINNRGPNKEMDGSTKQRRSCCCSSISLCDDYHGRYLISKAAELMTQHIKDELISNTKCPRDMVTLHIRTQDLKPVPTQFLKGLDSRSQLLDQILEKLNHSQVGVVGIFGMGGTGKTTLAKEVNKRVGDTYSIKVMVEVSEAPDIVRIQAAIAESIELPLHDVDDVAHRAIKLYNRLISEKENKVLIILDNIWKKLNLDEIGIPCTCKLLLTTREKEVCRVMNVRDANTLEVGVMNTDEAYELFKSQVGNKVLIGEYKNVVRRLLSKCGGLPLAIVATANSLKDKDLRSWKKFADDLDKPLSSQVTDEYHNTYLILDTSYKFIGVDEKRIFLLLACLFPIGSSASLENLMRYGIGLDLFRHVNKLGEAMDQADAWANELIQSSMLLEGDLKGDIKVHDIVRDFAISFAAKDEGHKFLLESIPRWLNDEFLIQYTAMSLTSRNDFSRLSGVEACKLQILILKGDMSPNIEDFSFNGMANLQVLSLSNMNYQPSLPESMKRLKKLKTLCMESCKLGDIKPVGEMVNLLVLSLRESFMEELPNEIGKLCKLRLLDLSGCTCSKVPLIPASVLGKLSNLEGLYMLNKRDGELETKFDNDRTRVIESYSLPYLNAFEIKVAETEGLPIAGQSIQNVDKFRVCVGHWDLEDETVRPFSRVLYFNGIDNMSGFLEKSSLNVLLKKADFLGMATCSYSEHLVPQFDQDGFRDLSYLLLESCDDIKYIVDGCGMNNLSAFPSLRSLELSNVNNLKMVCDGEPPPGTFSKLESLYLLSMDELVYVLPLVPRNLTEIRVLFCVSLKFVFLDDEETQVIELPFCRKLRFFNVPRIHSLVGPKMYFNSCEALQGMQVFFDKKIVLPSLELFALEGCHSVVKLWSKEIDTCGFHNLKDIKIERCEKLSSVGSPSVFSVIMQLETLSIKECNQMREVITVEEAEDSENGEQIIRFPQLKFLELGCLKNLQCFYGGRHNLEFPKLKKLELYVLGRMKRFATSGDNSALFHEKIDFPCLEELQVRSVNDEVNGLWDMQVFSKMSNPAPVLRKMTLSRTAGLRQIPSAILENLSSLALADVGDSVVFASVDLAVNEGFVWTYSELPNLEELKVEGSSSLQELFAKEDCNDADDSSLKDFCGRVKTLQLKDLPKLKIIPLHLFRGLASLILCKLNWEYAISVDALGDSLQQLQLLEIEECNNMEALVINVGLLIELPRLKQLRLFNLEHVKSFSSTSKREATLLLPSLESLEINFCPYLEYLWTCSIVAPKLQDVALYTCRSLQQLFIGNSEDMMELPSLRNVSFKWCDSIESISSGPLTAPKLREVQLWGCRNMQCFTPGKANDIGDLQLPSLEIVDIFDSPYLHSFSLRQLLAPKLTQIQYNGNEYSMLPYVDLNHFLRKNNDNAPYECNYENHDEEDEDLVEDDEDLNEDEQGLEEHDEDSDENDEDLGEDDDALDKDKAALKKRLLIGRKIRANKFCVRKSVKVALLEKQKKPPQGLSRFHAILQKHSNLTQISS